MLDLDYCKGCGKPIPRVPPSETLYKRCEECINDLVAKLKLPTADGGSSQCGNGLAGTEK